MPCDIIVAFNKKKNIAPEFGLIPIKRDNSIIVEDGVRRLEPGSTFIDNFKNFCENCLRTKKPIITSLQLIKIEC